MTGRQGDHAPGGRTGREGEGRQAPGEPGGRVRPCTQPEGHNRCEQKRQRLAGGPAETAPTVNPEIASVFHPEHLPAKTEGPRERAPGL